MAWAGDVEDFFTAIGRDDGRLVMTLMIRGVNPNARDAEGNVLAGSLTDAVETHDVWTFARTLKSSDPNWKLADTDEE